MSDLNELITVIDDQRGSKCESPLRSLSIYCNASTYRNPAELLQINSLRSEINQTKPVKHLKMIHIFFLEHLSKMYAPHSFRMESRAPSMEQEVNRVEVWITLDVSGLASYLAPHFKRCCLLVVGGGITSWPQQNKIWIIFFSDQYSDID